MTVASSSVRSRRMHKPWKIVTYARAARRIKNWPVFIAQLWRQREPKLFEIRGGAARYHVPTRLTKTFREVVVNDSYRMRRLIAEIGPKPVIVDVGANAGFFSVQAAELVTGAEIHSYEPLPGNFRALEQNRSLNPRLAPRVHPHECAVTGGPAGPLTIYTRVGATESGLASRYAEWTTGEKESVTVPTVTLSAIVSSLEPKTVDLLKVDCEGSEYDILFNTPRAILRRIKRIVMEVHTRPCMTTTRHDMVAFLCEQGYAIDEGVGHKGKNAMIWARRD